MGRSLWHGVVAAIVVVVSAVVSVVVAAIVGGPHILGRSVLDLGRSSLGTEAFYVCAQQDPWAAGDVRGSGAWV